MSLPVGLFAQPGSSHYNRTGSWRSERKPVHLHNRCTDCKLCVVYCPDGCIFGENKIYNADLDYCKGCGICAQICPVDDIVMEVEIK